MAKKRAGKQPQLQRANEKWNRWIRNAQKQEGITRQEAIKSYRRFRDALEATPTQADAKRYRGLFSLDRETPERFAGAVLGPGGRHRDAEDVEPEDFIDAILEVDLDTYEQVPA